MNKEVKYRAEIVGSGASIPDKVLTNDDLTKMVDTSDEWITSRTGIKKRHITTDEETTVMLSVDAARKALDSAEMKPEEVELIIIATITPEMVFPSTACLLQAQLGAKNAWAFDLSAACSGFVYSLSIAQQFIESGRYKNALVLGAETLTKITNFKDRGSCILFGDGAGAVVLRRTEDTSKGILYSTSYSDGNGWDILNCQAYGSKYPAGKDLPDPDMIYMYIRGRDVYQQAVRRIVETVEECLYKCGLTVDDLDMLISHQMNLRIIESAAKRLKLGPDRFFVNIHEYGNTSAASVPIAFDDCYRQGRIKKGDTVVFVAFGAGLTWGANVVRF